MSCHSPRARPAPSPLLKPLSSRKAKAECALLGVVVGAGRAVKTTTRGRKGGEGGGKGKQRKGTVKTLSLITYKNNKETIVTLTVGKQQDK